MTPVDPVTYTTKEVAVLLHIDQCYVTQLIAKGRLSARKNGAFWEIDAQALATQPVRPRRPYRSKNASITLPSIEAKTLTALLTLQEAALFLRVSPSRVRQLVMAHRLDTLQVGVQRFVTKLTLQMYQARCQTT